MSQQITYRRYVKQGTEEEVWLLWRRYYMRLCVSHQRTPDICWNGRFLHIPALQMTFYISSRETVCRTMEDSGLMTQWRRRLGIVYLLSPSLSRCGSHSHTRWYNTSNKESVKGYDSPWLTWWCLNRLRTGYICSKEQRKTWDYFNEDTTCACGMAT